MYKQGHRDRPLQMEDTPGYLDEVGSDPMNQSRSCSTILTRIRTCKRPCGPKPCHTSISSSFRAGYVELVAREPFHEKHDDMGSSCDGMGPRDHFHQDREMAHCKTRYDTALEQQQDSTENIS